MLHPEIAKQLQLPLPPTLVELIGADCVCDQYIALFYSNSKPRWKSADLTKDFYRPIWRTFTTHLAVEIKLYGYKLGSDFQPPEHTLILDTKQKEIYIAPLYSAIQVLEIQSVRQDTTLMPVPNHQPDCCFVPPSAHQADLFQQMVSWLDQLITPELIQAYEQEAKNGNLLAGDRLKEYYAVCNQQGRAL
jgi:hypothetical protein